MRFKSDDEMRRDFQNIDIYALVDEFSVRDEMYKLEIIVTAIVESTLK